MALNMILPELSAGMEDAVVAKWLVAVGDRVSKGQLIAEVETDKATMELEAETDGFVGALPAKEGQRTNVGEVIAVLLAEGEALGGAPKAQPVADAGPIGTLPPAAPAASSGATSSPSARQRISPLARRIAKAAGVSAHGIQGSGPGGRIVRIDIERLIGARGTSPPSAVPSQADATPLPCPTSSSPVISSPHRVLPLSSMRRTIARRLTESKQRVPHFYLEMECNAEALLKLRGEFNLGREKAEAISVNDVIIKLSATALRRVPEALTIWNEDSLIALDTVDLAVAVATDGGLYTPVVRDADKKSLGAISSEMKALVARAKGGKLKPEDYSGGGFSISNLGMFGVDRFSAIINPPQSSILAVGATKRRPVERADGSAAFASMLTLTLSVDHRAIHGATAARLLGSIRAGIENPITCLL